MKKKLTSEECHLVEVLRKISYSNKNTPQSILEYAKENEDLIKQIEEVTPGKYPSQKGILPEPLFRIRRPGGRLCAG